jgi:integrase
VGLRLPPQRRPPRPDRRLDEARRLSDALAVEDEALRATAMDAGLRHGETRAPRGEDLDLEHGRIHVRPVWDEYAGDIDPSSSRTSAPLRQRPPAPPLEDRLERTGRSGSDPVFGDVAGRPFLSTTVNDRARRAWKLVRQREDEQGVILEEPRLRPLACTGAATAVWQMLDAGISIDKVSKFWATPRSRSPSIATGPAARRRGGVGGPAVRLPGASCGCGATGRRRRVETI